MAAALILIIHVATMITTMSVLSSVGVLTPPSSSTTVPTSSPTENPTVSPTEHPSTSPTTPTTWSPTASPQPAYNLVYYVVLEDLPGNRINADALCAASPLAPLTNAHNIHAYIAYSDGDDLASFATNYGYPDYPLYTTSGVILAPSFFDFLIGNISMLQAGFSLWSPYIGITNNYEMLLQPFLGAGPYGEVNNNCDDWSNSSADVDYGVLFAYAGTMPFDGTSPCSAIVPGTPMLCVAEGNVQLFDHLVLFPFDYSYGIPGICQAFLVMQPQFSLYPFSYMMGSQIYADVFGPEGVLLAFSVDQFLFGEW